MYLLKLFGRHLAQNMVGYLALMIALSGSAYAATQIGSNQILDNSLRSIDLRDGSAVRAADVVDGSLTGKDVKNGSIGGADVAEGTLAEVPRAAQAGRTINWSLNLAGGSVGKILLDYRGIELAAQCWSTGAKLEARTAHSGTWQDALVVRGASLSATASPPSRMDGGWMPVATWFVPVASVANNEKADVRQTFQWGTGVVDVHVVMRHFDQGPSCYFAGTAVSGG